MAMIRFKNKEEFDDHFKAMAEYNDEEFDDSLCIEGNSNTHLKWLRYIAECVGYENISVDDYLGYTDTIHIDISKNPKGDFPLFGNDISYCNGKIKIWYD